MPRMSRSILPTSVFEDMSNGVTLPPAYEEDEDDVEYDVYLYWSSTAPHVLIPEHLAQDPLLETSSPTAYSHRSESSDELHTVSLAPPRSSAHSFESNDVFPERNEDGEMDIAGYSRLFTAGLALRSRQITRQLDSAYRNLRRVFGWSTWFNRSS